MLNKISTFRTIVLYLSSYLLSALVSTLASTKAMEPERITVKSEPGISMKTVFKSPHSREYVERRLACINPGYDQINGIRTKNCLPVAIKGYEFLSLQFDEPEVADDRIPNAPNISLRKTGRLLLEDDYVPPTPNFEQIDEEVSVYRELNEKDLINLLDDYYYKSARFAKVKFYKNQYNDVMKFEDYIQNRISELKISCYGSLAGIIYLDYTKNPKGVYLGHFVNFYTLVKGTSYEILVCDFHSHGGLSNEVWSLSDFISLFCGPTGVYRNQFYVWSGERFQEYVKGKEPVVKSEKSKALSNKRSHDNPNLDSNIISKKSRMVDDAASIASSSTEEEHLDNDMDVLEKEGDFEQMGPHFESQSSPQFSFSVPMLDSLGVLRVGNNNHNNGTAIPSQSMVFPVRGFTLSGKVWQQAGNKFLPVRKEAARSIYSSVQTLQVQELLARLVNIGDDYHRDTTGQVICLGMDDKAPWAQEQLDALVKSVDVNQRVTAAKAIYFGMENKVIWAQEKLAALINSVDVNERDTANRAINFGIMKSTPWWREMSLISEQARLSADQQNTSASDQSNALRNSQQSSQSRALPPTALPFTLPGNKLIGRINTSVELIGARSAGGFSKLPEQVKSVDFATRTLATSICSGVQNKEPWAQKKLAALEKGNDFKDRDLAAQAIEMGMQSKALWAQEKLAVLEKSSDYKDRELAAQAIEMGMQSKALWAQEKLAELEKSKDWKERATAIGVKQIGERTRASWFREKSPMMQTQTRLSADQEKTSSSNQSNALRNSQQSSQSKALPPTALPLTLPGNRAPSQITTPQQLMSAQLAHVYSKLSEQEKSGDGVKILALSIYFGVKNKEPWAQEKLAVLEKSKDCKDRELAAQAIEMGMQSKALWAQEKLAALKKSEDWKERDTAFRVINFGKQIKAMEPQLSLYTIPSLADSQIPLPSHQDTVDYKALYMSQQNDLQKAFQEIERLKRELEQERAKTKG